MLYPSPVSPMDDTGDVIPIRTEARRIVGERQGRPRHRTTSTAPAASTTTTAATTTATTTTEHAGHDGSISPVHGARTGFGL